MYSIERIEELLANSEDTLLKYENLLKGNPNSLFNKGMVKNTLEQMIELRSNLAFEKQKREKEIIDIRLKGKVAKVGKLPLDLLGEFAKSLSDCIIESSRKYQYGNKGGAKILTSIKNTVDLRFDRLVPGSTHILVTGNNSPDLFGNSMIENALINTFELLNVHNDSELMNKSEKYGGAGIKKLNKILNLSINNHLEFDLEWSSPNSKVFKWEGNFDRIKQLNNSISKIETITPEEIEISGTLVMQSLKGQLEIEEDGGKLFKVSFPMSFLDKIKEFQIGENFSAIIIKNTLKNSITKEEKASFELAKILE
ncbi:hypothetical protein [Flavobacterium commune]|uniref:Uncharacterized protein n=1 Tax=Flavobacterium commune TaxID=1306519 RepID=A0A1D9PAY6_9FLAO|nr:hypothetical protein [Flavobacterium commune]AOZ99245.1 hypothetical protein BIW12_07205 [Flavobacterium commune]